MAEFTIAKQRVGNTHPTYFIADIAANHDGDLSRAKDLISRAKEAGADAAKFQHFRAAQIVSDYGFKHLQNQSHQKVWKKSVYEVYADASLDWEWTEALAAHCTKEDIHFFSSPYDIQAVDHLEPYVPAYKIGSGDITWLDILAYIAQKPVPVILATGASSMQEVISAMDVISKHNNNICIMQCNTNYTASMENFRHLSLNVLKTYGLMFPHAVLGLSDHTHGHSSVLGAVALGARIIEKHFTDDNSREGPDHVFSMNPESWRTMVQCTRELELALGSAIKRVEKNETATVVAQRRCIRAARDLPQGHIITKDDLEMLRPALRQALPPTAVDVLIGKKLKHSVVFGYAFEGKEVE